MYQIGDKVQMRRLKDMQCEYETMPPYYVGNLLIRKGTGFLKYMVIFLWAAISYSSTKICGWA